MKVLALALADEAQRFVRGYPARGSYLHRIPNPELLRLAALAGHDTDFRYVDERVALAELSGDEDLVLAHVDFFHESSARQLAGRYPDAPMVFLGRLATAWQDSPPSWVRSWVRGDILSVWPRLRRDAEHRSLLPCYQTDQRPCYVVPDTPLRLNPELNTGYQSTHFVRGCFCPAELRPFCREWLYYGPHTHARTKEEILGELLALPGKTIHLLDDDVARFPAYYHGVFRALWNFRRHWIVNASERIFEHPRLIRLMAKAGVRAVLLNESFLHNRLARAVEDRAEARRLYRRVKSLQAARMVVGVRVPVRLDRPGMDFDRLARLLHQIDVDLIEAHFYRSEASGPMPVRSVYRPRIEPTEPAWLLDRFYSIGAIAERVARRPRRVGFYTTLLFLLPHCLAARQDMLEGLARW